MLTELLSSCSYADTDPHTFNPEHESCPKQSIYTSPSREQTFKFPHESFDRQSISICCVWNAVTFKLSHG